MPTKDSPLARPKSVAQVGGSVHKTSLTDLVCSTIPPPPGILFAADESLLIIFYNHNLLVRSKNRP